MNINYEKNQIIIFGKPIKFDGMVRKIASLSGEQLYNFLSGRSVLMPRKMNCMAMISVLNDKIKFLHSKSLSKDYFKRLQYYKSFTETQLEILFEDICNDQDSYDLYRFNLAQLILFNYENLQITDGEINYLKTVNKTKQNSFREYCQFISAASLEQENTFDGTDYELLQRDLMFTATVDEVQAIGKKYGVLLPDRLTKEQYIDFILYYLGGEGEIEENTEKELNDMTIAGLSQFAKEKGVPLQPQLDKSGIVYYLFYYLSQCEISLTEIENIMTSDIYKPLDFTVDLAKISPFGNTDAKRIIHYENEELDTDKMNEILESINGEEEEVIEEKQEFSVPDAPILPGSTDKLEIDNDEILKETDDGQLEVVEVKTNDTNNVKNDDSLTDEEIMKIISKDKKDDKVKEEYISKIDADKVNENEYYGKKRFAKINKGPKRFVLPVIGIVLLCFVACFICYAAFR